MSEEPMQVLKQHYQESDYELNKLLFFFLFVFITGGLFGDVDSNGVNEAAAILNEVDEKYGICKLYIDLRLIDEKIFTLVKI